MPDTLQHVIAMLLVAPLSGLAADILLHCILARTLPGGAHVRIQLISFGAGSALTAGILAALLWHYPFSSADRIGYLLLHVMIYSSFGFGMFNVINANVSSVRVRMLKEYLALDPIPLSDAAMCQRYQTREMLSARLVRLADGGQIYTQDGRYHARMGSVILIGRFFAALRRVLLPS